MTKRRLSIVAAILIGLAGFGAAMQLLTPTPAYAAQEQIKNQQAGKLFKEADKERARRNIRGAIAKIKEAQAVSGLSKHDKFILTDYLGYLYYLSRDYGHAAQAYEEALNSGEAPASSVPGRVKALSAFYNQVRNYSKAISYAKRYLKQYGWDSDLGVIVAQAYYQERNYRAAMSAAQDIVDHERGNRSAKTRESIKHALNIVLSSAYQVHDHAVVKRTLYTLVAEYPNAADWTRLVNLVKDEGGLDDQLSLALQHLQMDLGLFTTGDQYFALGKLAVVLEIPGDAEQVLQDGFQKKLLGSAPEQRDQRMLKLAQGNVAKDKAALAQRAAQAKASSEPKDEILLGLAYASYGQYDKAVAAIKAGIQKAGKDTVTIDDAQIALGRTYLMAHKTAEARRAFEAVKGSEIAKDIAHMWLIGMNQHH